MTAKVKDLQKQVEDKSKILIYLILVLLGACLAINSQYFTIEAQIYIPGLGGVTQGISYVISDLVVGNSGTWTPDDIRQLQLVVYWPIYVVMNIPIFVFMYIKYGMKFTARTTAVFVSSFSLGLILANVPPFNTIHIIPPINDLAGNSGYQFLYFARILLLGLLGASFYGVLIGTAFKNGGSTAGLDPIVKYISREKGINLSRVLFYVGIMISFSFIFIRAFTNHNGPMFWEVSDPFVAFLKVTLLSPQMISSFIFMVVYSKVAGAIYQPTKRLQLNVISTKITKLSEHLNKENYHRGHTLYETMGGFSKEQRLELQMIINMEELEDVSKDIASIVPDAMIIVSEVNKIYDRHDWTPKTKYDMEIEEKRKIAKEKHRKQKNKNDKK